jgi:RHH-type proline utilization regulon transcriptional repressor/proline dehydrogenase/delta 1-pyrroline-5-carboxylate dehydrogenase
LLPAGLPQIVRDALATVDQQALAQAEVRMALVDAALAATWLPKLAARDGAVVPLIETTGTDPVPLWRLVAERAVCVNTTAAGGNASLMTLEA